MRSVSHSSTKFRQSCPTANSKHKCTAFYIQLYLELHSESALGTESTLRYTYKHVCVYMYINTQVFIYKEVILTEIKGWGQVEVLLEEMPQSISKHGSTKVYASTAQQTVRRHKQAAETGSTLQWCWCSSICISYNPHLGLCLFSRSSAWFPVTA